MLLSKSQMKLVKYLGMNANEIGSENKPLKMTLTKSYQRRDILEKISPNFVAELASSSDKVKRRLYKFVIGLGY